MLFGAVSCPVLWAYFCFFGYNSYSVVKLQPAWQVCALQHTRSEEQAALVLCILILPIWCACKHGALKQTSM